MVVSVHAWSCLPVTPDPLIQDRFEFVHTVDIEHLPHPLAVIVSSV